MYTRTSRLQRIQRKNNNSTRKLLFFVGIIFVVLAIFLIFKAVDFYKNINKNGNSNVKPTQKPEEKNTYDILLLGYGGGNHDGTYLTDTIMVLHIDLKQKSSILISIPRDIWVKLPTDSGEEFHSKINSVYQIGLFPKNYPDVSDKYTGKGNETGLIKHVVEQITGLQIDAYVGIDFQGFVEAVDILGGIDVTVDRTFNDYEYPIEGKENDPCDKKDQELEEALKIATEDARLAFPCRYEHLQFQKGPAHLDGKTALKFARSRHALEDGGDFNRAQRQQKVIEAVKEKVLSVNFIPKIIPLLDNMKAHIATDLPTGELQKLLLEAPNSNKYKRSSLVLTESNFLTSSFSEYGGYIIIPKAGLDDWSEVQKEVKFMKMGITPTLTPTITPTPAPTSKIKSPTPTKKPL